MTIYVTGSSGVLGFEILSHLHGAGFDAMGVARRPLPRSGRGLRQISTPEVLTAGWMPRPRGETIVHCAGLPSPRVHFNDFSELSRREIEPQLRFAEKLLAKGWRGHMVYLSSAGVYGDTDQLPIAEDAPLAAKSWYALQKMAVEPGAVVPGAALWFPADHPAGGECLWRGNRGAELWRGDDPARRSAQRQAVPPVRRRHVAAPTISTCRISARWWNVAARCRVPDRSRC